MDMLVVKIIIILVIFASGVVGGLMPRILGKTAKGGHILVLGSAFTGGVFLGAGLIHLLGDGLEMMNDFAGDVEFPWAFFILGIGFLLILFFEKILSRGGEIAATQSKQPFVLLLILSLHSIIAGAALGLEASIASSLVLFFAIVAHKGFASFALGISFHDAQFDKAKTRFYIILFSIMTPLGVVGGTLLASLLESQAVIGAEAIFDSLAAGTFLYVATFEVLRESFESHEHRISKFVLATLGFLLMAVIAIWA